MKLPGIGLATLYLAFLLTFGGCGNEIPENEIPETDPNATYENGVYTEHVDYYSPSGQESFEISLTIENDVVTKFETESITNSSTSEQFQELFLEEVEQIVVGQPVGEIYVDYINGSSLLAEAFNEAIRQIQMEARVE